MKIIEIFGGTEKTKEFTASVFCVTMNGIYTESKEFGFFKRDDMDMSDLENHIKTMKSEGFIVREYQTV